MVELKPSALIYQQWSRKAHETFQYIVYILLLFYIGEGKYLRICFIMNKLVLTINFFFAAARIWDLTSQDMQLCPI